MTNRQAKICKIILRYKRLDKILKKSRIEDYYELQLIMGSSMLEFSDYDFEDDTIVCLNNALLEEFETRKRDIFYKQSSLIVSIIAVAISILAFLFTIGSDSVLWNLLLH